MKIRVDKCVTFGTKKSSTKSIQYQPKLIIDGILVPAVKNSESFRYLGRHFDFDMSSLKCASKRLSLVSCFLSRCLGRKWLELPVSTILFSLIAIPQQSLSNIVLPYSKFGLNIQLPSTEFIQCQTVLRNALRASPNKDIQALWKSTSSHTNIQYDTYRNTKDVLKAIHNDQEDRLRHHLISQGSFFSNVIDKSLSKVIPLWSTAQRHLPKNIFNFSIRYISNSLPNRTNLTKWGMSPTSDCSFCIQPESLLHIVAGCKKYREEGRYTWHHDSILYFLANYFQSIKNSYLYVDIPGYISPCALTGDSLRPDLLLVIPDKCL